MFYFGQNSNSEQLRGNWRILQESVDVLLNFRQDIVYIVLMSFFIQTPVNCIIR